MPTDAEIGAHLVMAGREVRAWRAKGVIPAAGATLDAAREAYIRHIREAAAGRLPSVEKSGLDAEKTRVAREQADQIAMRNAAMRRELVPLGPISQAIVGMIEVAKGKLRRVPAKVAPSDQDLKDRIANAIEDALLDVSAGRALEAEADDDVD